jgi:tRNA (cytidine/uridine-2'-O-)-methyltransferase
VSFQIVLVEPEIPQNTGNIARTCAVTASPLHLVHPLGFSLADRYLKRAGLDYWKDLELYQYRGLDHFLEEHGHKPLLLFSKFAKHCYTDIEYPDGCFLLFGSESRGLPEKLKSEREETCLRIPMKPGSRSLNLSNAVAIVLYEALRRQGFKGLV